VNPINLTTSQLQLRQTRNEFRALVGELQTDSFPRSATMKLLLSAGGQKTIAYVLGGTRLGSLLGLMGPSSTIGRVFRSVIVGALIKRLLPRKRR
jgi:hypothetical protein